MIPIKAKGMAAPFHAFLFITALYRKEKPENPIKNIETKKINNAKSKVVLLFFVIIYIK
uniref:hypothetical protein n=1 Tax=Staphylococcus simulans TaxID=1286 RepID=UPI00155D934C|nr:hypothetical protein [Staphylococcus simulans]